MTSDPAGILASAIPGTEIKSGKRFQVFRRKVPQAWKLWHGAGTDWAAFVVVGEHLPTSDQEGVAAAYGAGLNPVLVVPSYEELTAIAPHYQKIRPYLAYEIAGSGSLIPPMQTPTGSVAPAAKSGAPRIPTNLIDELALLPELPSGLSDLLRRLSRQYKPLKKLGTFDDVREERILLEFAKALLTLMGLAPDRINAAQLVRTLEGGGLGARRDHFFHSFQNFFLGLPAIAKLRSSFEAYKDEARIHWNVDPFHVWFLTALWHDVGYSFQRFDTLIHATLGFSPTDEAINTFKEDFLRHELTLKALAVISSLMSRLLHPTGARSEWMPPPSPNSNLGAHATSVKQALSANVRRSHGAVGALRLYCAYSADLDLMEPEHRDLLMQTVLIACSSMPFHDWSFRDDVRGMCGQCHFRTQDLPFGALLAFVDSIQDDRRDLSGATEAALILEQLLISPPATIEAQVNHHAFDDRSLLEKIIEAGDVLAALQQTKGGLFFKYPEWMVGLNG